MKQYAIGYFEKRDCPGNRISCEGTAEIVRIENNEPVYLFIPTDKRLRPVEATLKIKEEDSL